MRAPAASPVLFLAPSRLASSSAGAWIGQPAFLTLQRAGGFLRTCFNRWLGLVRVITFEWGLGGARRCLCPSWPGWSSAPKWSKDHPPPSPPKVPFSFRGLGGGREKGVTGGAVSFPPARKKQLLVQVKGVSSRMLPSLPPFFSHPPPTPFLSLLPRLWMECCSRTLVKASCCCLINAAIV